MRVLVTGSNGFVGSRIATLLRARGDFVIGLGRSKVAAGSVNQYLCHDLAQPLPFAEPADAVVHCAAMATPWARPAAY